MVEVSFKMRIVYTGSLEQGGTCLARLEAARRIVGSTNVVALDRDQFFSDLGRLRHALELRVFFAARSRALNAKLLRVVERERPDVVWVDKGTWVFPSTLRRIAEGGTFLAHHNTDALRPLARQSRWLYTLLRSTIGQYDLVFTTNLHDYRILSASMPGRVELTSIGFDHIRFNADPIPEDEKQLWASDVIFVGHWEPRTERGIRALRRAGIAVRVHGRGWEHAVREDIPGSIYPGAIPHGDYVKALKSAKIGLGFVSEWNGNQTAGRSFEIPACGTFLLAPRTPQHIECYVEGEEAEFFEGEDELVGKAQRYLEDDSRRTSVAAAGRRKVVAAGYSWERYMRDDLARVEARLPHRSALGRRTS
jgi:spore maturation protein CgeB